METAHVTLPPVCFFDPDPVEHASLIFRITPQTRYMFRRTLPPSLAIIQLLVSSVVLCRFHWFDDSQYEIVIQYVEILYLVFIL